MEPTGPALLKVEAAAKFCQISRSKAYAMAKAGTLPGVVRIGGSVRVSERALRAWIDREASASSSG